MQHACALHLSCEAGSSAAAPERDLEEGKCTEDSLAGHIDWIVVLETYLYQNHCACCEGQGVQDQPVSIEVSDKGPDVG